MLYFEKKPSVNVLGKRTNFNIPPHIHSAVEISYINKGKTTVFVDQQTVELGAGDIYISFPLQLHGHINDSEDIEGYIMILIPSDFADFENIFLTMRPENRIVHDNDGKILTHVKNAIELQNEDISFKQSAVIGAVNVVLSLILSKTAFNEYSTVDMTIAEKILDYCDTKYMEDISLDSLAKEVGASKFYISKIFKNKIKSSFPEYINTIRVLAAKRFLKTTSMSITEIAEKVGFFTLRTFNRSFLKTTGMTPSEYRRSAQKAKP